MWRIIVLAVLASVVGCSTTANLELTPVKRAPSFAGEYFNLTELDSIPALTKSGALEYPRLLKARHLSGRAVVGFILNEEGRPTQIQCVAASGKMFGDAAIASVRSSRYSPPIKEGKAVSCVMLLPFDFDWRLENTAEVSSEFTPAELSTIYSQSATISGYSLVSVVRETRNVAKVTLASENEPPKAKILYFDLVRGRWLLNKAKTEDATLLIP